MLPVGLLPHADRAIATSPRYASGGGAVWNTTSSGCTRACRTFYYQSVLRNTCGLTSLTPKRSRFHQGGLLYSQFYAVFPRKMMMVVPPPIRFGFRTAV